MTTADERAADKIGRAIDGQIRALQQEKDMLTGAGPRIAEINQELLILQAEKALIDPRRPPGPSVNSGPSATAPVANDLPGRVL